jgi:glycosyltransferase involved in cell wall biosynthesis
MTKEFVIFLSYEFPPYIFGGVGTFSKLIAEILSKKGLKVIVIAGKAQFSKRVHIEKINESLYVVRAYFPSIPPRWIYFSLPAHNIVEELIKTKEPRLIISNSPLAYLAIKNLGIERKVKVISIYHNSPYHLQSFFSYVLPEDIKMLNVEELYYYLQFPLLKYLMRLQLEMDDFSIFVAKHVFEEYKILYPNVATKINNSYAIIYLGVEYKRLIELFKKSQEKKPKKDKIIIAYIGRLYYTKGAAFALKSLEKLINEYHEKEVELWIFGKGSLEAWIRRQVKKKNLNQYVKLWGFVDRERLLLLLAKYVDVLLHPSLYEGSPLAVMESQVLGIPTVSFDFSWSREFIINGINGYRATYPDIESLAKGIIKASELSREKIANLAYRYDIALSVRTLEDIIYKIINSNS